jgi:hypothetical protein
MRGERPIVVSQGGRYRLVLTDSYGGICRRRLWGWRLVARYPLTDEGWSIAQGQFAIWEPHAMLANNMPAAGAENRGRWSQRWLWIAAGFAVILAATGAGLYFGSTSSSVTGTASQAPSGSAKAAAAKPAVGSGYLASGSAWVVFIQWTDDHGILSGSVQDVTTTGQPPKESVTTDTISVAGNIRGAQITLSFNGGNQQFGTLAAGSFTVNVPQRSGALAPITFHATSVTRYNAVVAQLHAQVTSANNNEARTQEVAAEEAKVNAAATQVSSDIAALGKAEANLSAAVAAIPPLLKTETVDLATTAEAEQNVLAEKGSTIDSVCNDADGVANDADGVANDADGVASAVDQVSSELTSGFGTNGMHQLMADLTQARSTLKTAEAQLPTYHPTDLPTTKSVSSARSAATADAKVATTTTNGYIGKANATEATAFQDASASFTETGCGSGISPPSPISTIT